MSKSFFPLNPIKTNYVASIEGEHPELWLQSKIKNIRLLSGRNTKIIIFLYEILITVLYIFESMGADTTMHILVLWFLQSP